MVKIFFFLVLISFAGCTMYIGAGNAPVTQTKIIKAVKIPVTVE